LLLRLRGSRRGCGSSCRNRRPEARRPAGGPSVFAKENTKTMATMSAAKRRMTQARSNLVLEEPFFGILGLNLDLVEDPNCETAWTDGTRLGYNPRYVENMDLPHAIGLVCHEVMHCVAGHPWRRGAREHKKFNVACDYAIDKPIQDAGFKVPDALLNPQFDNKSAEWIYSRLPDGTGGGGSGPGGQLKGCGEVRDSPVGQPGTVSQAQFNNFVIQAANNAKAQGKLPASLSHLVSEIEDPKVDWKSTLRKFVQETAMADYTWRQPNRRYLGLGLFLPTLRSEQMPAVVVGIDTSGSISNDELAAFLSEVQSIIDETQPETTYLIQCDAAVQDVREIPRGDDLGSVTVHGRGGTDFRPVFDHVAREQWEIACLIYLTDMMGSFPEEETDYPTIWVSTMEDVKAPMGETLYMLDGGVDR
jgi:predicted metal-dependent peptidase